MSSPETSPPSRSSATPSGIAVAKFNVAVNSRIPSSDGGFEDRLDGFFQIVAWRTLAENAVASLHKGTRVVVAGKLTRRSWEAEDGSKRFAVEIIADEVATSLKFATAEVSKLNGAGPVDDSEPEDAESVPA